MIPYHSHLLLLLSHVVIVVDLCCVEGLMEVFIIIFIIIIVEKVRLALQNCAAEGNLPYIVECRSLQSLSISANVSKVFH